MSSHTTNPYAQALITLCLSSPQPILRFGTFTLKSGRISPYFFNFGLCNTGQLLNAVAIAFTDAIIETYPHIGLSTSSDTTPEVLFGPAYKGIPLVATVSVELARRGRDIGYAYNRKEVKDHGEGGSIVGASLAGKRVLIIDDVITKGVACREAFAIVQKESGTTVGIVSALDRQERGNGELSTVQEVEKELGITVVSVVKMVDVIEWLEREGKTGEVQALDAYRQQYGV